MPTNFNLDADLAEARSRRDAIKRNLETLHRDAGGEELRGGDGERWENLARGLEGVEAEIESLEDERAERNARTDHLAKLAQNPGNLERAVPMPEPRDGSGDNPRMSRVRSDALRANERAEFMPERCRESMEQALRGDDDPEARMAQVVVATADRDYFRAFASWFRDPISGGHSWTEPERAAVRRVQHLERAMALGAGGTGGFLVPYELDPSILIANAGAVSPLREVARVATTALNEKRFVTSLGVTSTWTPEAIEQPDDSPALLQPAITCKKGAAFVPVSLELFEDSGIAQEVGALFADAKAVHEALSFTITQSNGPVGIITALMAAGGSTVIATGTNVLAQGDLYANQAALPARWRPNAKWMMNLSILNGYRQLPQATGLNYRWSMIPGRCRRRSGGRCSRNSTWTARSRARPPTTSCSRATSSNSRSSIGSAPRSK